MSVISKQSTNHSETCSKGKLKSTNECRTIRANEPSSHTTHVERSEHRTTRRSSIGRPKQATRRSSSGPTIEPLDDHRVVDPSRPLGDRRVVCPGTPIQPEIAGTTPIHALSFKPRYDLLRTTAILSHTPSLFELLSRHYDINCAVQDVCQVSLEVGGFAGGWKPRRVVITWEDEDKFRADYPELFSDTPVVHLRLAPNCLPSFFSNWHMTITSCLLALFLRLSCEKHMKGLEFLQVKERTVAYAESAEAAGQLSPLSLALF
ncbi:hypothetical protein F2Q69_00021700 [Brassica cretica]|uniref:Uncharacterized protein n=1 Tax=Brassica cretica TaxID=69181 RepID=A0A8S9PV92_BRACR|nr:hypothetical protein F2Q69_00021700 [Brassica cretica]